MPSKSTYFLNAAGAAASIAVGLICILLIPREKWDVAQYATFVSLLVSVWLLIAPPRFVVGYGITNAGTVASLSLSAAPLLVFFIGSLLTLLACATVANRTFVWVGLVASVGGPSVGMLLMRSSAAYVDHINLSSGQGADTWAKQELLLADLKSLAAPEYQQSLSELAEAFVYAARDDRDQSGLQMEAEITKIIDEEMREALSRSDQIAFQKSLSAVQSLLSRREALLLEKRSGVGRQG